MRHPERLQCENTHLHIAPHVRRLVFPESLRYALHSRERRLWGVYLGSVRAEGGCASIYAGIVQQGT